MTGASPDGYLFVHANSGGEALDRATAGQYHYAMVAEDSTDLPSKMLVRSLKTQSPDMVVLTFLGPSDNGRVELVETASTRRISPWPGRNTRREPGSARNARSVASAT